MGLDEALERLGRRYESAAEADLDAWDSDIEDVTARYTTEYVLDADRPTAAVCGYSRQLPGLTVRVEMHADTNPNNAWWTATAVTNPTANSSDPLSLQCTWGKLLDTHRPEVRHRCHRGEFRGYADRFVVAAEATGIERGLRVGVHVTADKNPFIAWCSERALTNPGPISRPGGLHAVGTRP